MIPVFPRRLVPFSIFFLLANLAVAQRGDTPGEGPQTPLPVAKVAQPMPAKSAAEEAKTFTLAPGFRIELVAAEPAVRDGVAAAFDLEGNLYVAEMTRFNAGMIKDVPVLAGDVTSVPASAIVKLESTHHDGHYDRHTVFLDGLNAPRALAVVHDGVLIADPPRLWLARDTDGDGRSDEKVLLAGDYGIDLVNESNANGLVWGRDNILHNICYAFDFRFRGGKLERMPVPIRGEFGLSQDDDGRLFFNRNSDQLRCDLYPPYYTMRNPNLTSMPWANDRIAESQEIWPGHATPVVNRGYRKGEIGRVNGGLRDDGALMEFSAACGPLVYRGANFPADCYGNVFVAEPAANMIKRDRLIETEGKIRAVNVYEGKEFLTSTDPRFRPVALLNAPDGSMFIVDFYRGMLEEYHLDTSYLVQQSAVRGLEKPMFGQGRIWRVTYDGGPVESRIPNLKKLDGAGLTALLAQANAWWRDAAQQELVERGGTSAVAALAELARTAPDARTKVYALWTLDGLGATTRAILRTALSDSSAKVRSAAVRLHERWLATPDADGVMSQLETLIDDPAAEVAVQLAFTLGEAKTDRGLAAMDRLFLARGGHSYIPAAIVSGLRGREGLFFNRLADEVGRTGERPEMKAILSLLASAIVHGGDRAQIDALMARVSDAGRLPDWSRLAVLDGLDALGQAAFRRTITPGRLMPPESLAPLVGGSDGPVKARAAKLQVRLVRLVEEAKARTKAARPLTPAEAKLAASGQATFQICAGCHQPNGGGLPNVAPSLVESPWVAGSPEMLVRIVLNGKEGTPGFPGAMPPIGISFTDDQIAAVLTYVRNSWGLQYGAVSPETVAHTRRQVASRVNAWTAAELTQLQTELAKAAK